MASRRALFDEVERSQLKPLPSTPFEYAEWKVAKVHPDYHVEVDKTFYSVPHGLIGRRVDIRLTYRAVEIFFDHKRVARHIRSSQRSGHITVNEHMPRLTSATQTQHPTHCARKQRKSGPIRRPLSNVCYAIAHTPNRATDPLKAFSPWRAVTNPIGWSWLASGRWSSTRSAIRLSPTFSDLVSIRLRP